MTAERTLGHAPVDAVAGLPAAAADAKARFAVKPSLVSTLRRILLVPVVLAVGYAVATELSTESATLRRLSLFTAGGAALWAARAGRVGAPSTAVD
jgi:hypothetical protein